MEQKKKKKKDPIIAAVLCWLLGAFGGHRFYVGRKRSAIAMLLISLTVIGLLVTWVWAIIDFITILTGNFEDDKRLLVKKW